jgi:hypothetical protein
MKQYDDRDKDYAKLRNSLIPEAEKFTNKHCGVSYEGENQKEREAWSAKWSRCFVRRMDHLYAETQAKPVCPFCGGKGVIDVARSEGSEEHGTEEGESPDSSEIETTADLGSGAEFRL